MSRRLVKMRAFTLPGEEKALNEILNNPDFVVVEEIKTPCPKEGIFMVLIKWEFWGDEEGGAGLL